jgi:hypothetical protein
MSVSSSAPLASSVCYHHLAHLLNRIRYQSLGHDRDYGRGGGGGVHFAHRAQLHRCDHVCGAHDVRDGLCGALRLGFLLNLRGQLGVVSNGLRVGFVDSANL